MQRYLSELIQSSHPVIRVASFLVLAIFLALGQPQHLLLISVFIVMCYFALGWPAVRAAGPMLWRMRWFFLSILLVYLWLSPGPLTWMSAWHGAYRVLVLVLMVFAVHALLSLSSRNELVSAIYCLAWPLSLLGISRQRLAVRVALVLEYVPRVQQICLEREPALGDGRIARAANTSVALYAATLAQASSSTPHELELDVSAAPSRREWMLPLALVVLLLFIA